MVYYRRERLTVVEQPNEATEHPGNASRAGTKRLLYWSAGLSVGALVAHAIDVPDHIAEWWGYSAFFVTIAAFQFFYGFGLLFQPWRYDESGDERPDSERHGRPYYLLGVILTTSSVVLYIVTRTTGLPFLGPAAGAERVTSLSLVPTIESVPLVYCLMRLYLESGAKPRPKSNP